jgi:hypothetical protein
MPGERSYLHIASNHPLTQTLYTLFLMLTTAHQLPTQAEAQVALCPFAAHHPARRVCPLDAKFYRVAAEIPPTAHSLLPMLFASRALLC